MDQVCFCLIEQHTILTRIFSIGYININCGESIAISKRLIPYAGHTARDHDARQGAVTERQTSYIGYAFGDRDACQAFATKKRPIPDTGHTGEYRYIPQVLAKHKRTFPYAGYTAGDRDAGQTVAAIKRLFPYARYWVSPKLEGYGDCATAANIFSDNRLSTINIIDIASRLRGQCAHRKQRKQQDDHDEHIRQLCNPSCHCYSLQS